MVVGGERLRRRVERAIRFARADRPGDPLDERHDLALGEGAHEPVEWLAVLEGDDRRDRLDAELTGDLRMVVDVHLDQPHLASRGTDGLLQNGRELLAWAAPRCPEIDQHRNGARRVQHVGSEGLGRRILDEIGGCRRGGSLLVPTEYQTFGAHGCSSVPEISPYLALSPRFSNPASSGLPETRRIAGSCPVCRRKARKSSRAMVLVAVFSSGWKLSRV